jgi:uncharacterized protein (TIGR02996 family)
MTEHLSLLQALLASPGDDTLRSVYADWLQERGDPRGDYLRFEMQLAHLSPASPEARELRARMVGLRPQLDRLWLAHIDQPDVQRANPTPFPAGWLSTDLGDYRPDPGGTYGACAYASLPRLPVESFRGDFAWLKSSPPWERISHVNRQEWRRRVEEGVARVAAQARALGLPLPPEFGLFLGDPEFMCRIRSCTDCFFDATRRIVPSPRGEDGYLIRFYADSQGCGFWYLYLTPGGYSCVVSSAALYGGVVWAGSEDLAGEEEEPPRDDLEGSTEFCAPSFEAFLYRYWMENEIWYALHSDHTPLTPEQQAYVDHYRR